jgi:transposase
MPPHLLTDPAHLRLEYLRAENRSITVIVSAKDFEGRCPLCHHSTQRIHSRYHRTLADLPWNGVAVRLRLTVRRFFCQTSDCQRRIFTERLPDLVAPHGRRTLRLTEAMELIGFAVGGEAGARLLVGLSVTTSPDTILRIIRAADLGNREVPRVLGVDDWAFRRGHRYGTILVDLERRRVVDLLPDRKPETVIAWLEQHGSPEIVSRDRGGGYAEAARRGAPDAIQVADRFHLAKNLVDTLETLFLRKRSLLKEVAAIVAEERVPPEEEDVPQDAMYQGKRKSPHNWQRRAEEASAARHAERVATYEAIHALHTKGADIAHIACTVGVSRRTVYRYTRMDGPPERARPGRRPGNRVLAPYEPYLLQRWKEGCHNGVKLWREIQELGFAYSVTNVSRFLAHLRREGRPPTPVGKTGSALSNSRGPTARRAAFLCVAHREDLEDEDVVYLERLRSRDEVIKQAYHLVQRFMQMLRDRQGDQLGRWIQQAKDSGIDELRRFATGLNGDRAAVQAGLTEVWSNGPVEGHVNRLKLLKRQMYGRANFDLLRQRVLYAA